MLKLWCDVALTRNKNENCSSSELAIIVSDHSCKKREREKKNRKYKVQLQEVPDMHALYLKYFLNSI